MLILSCGGVTRILAPRHNSRYEIVIRKVNAPYGDDDVLPIEESHNELQMFVSGWKLFWDGQAPSSIQWKTWTALGTVLLGWLRGSLVQAADASNAITILFWISNQRHRPDIQVQNADRTSKKALELVASLDARPGLREMREKDQIDTSTRDITTDSRAGATCKEKS